VGAVHPFLAFAPEVRRIIDTTNAIESLTTSYARSSRSAVTSHDTVVIMLLWLAIRDIEDNAPAPEPRRKGYPQVLRPALILNQQVRTHDRPATPAHDLTRQPVAEPALRGAGLAPPARSVGVLPARLHR
jgi:hypothetical protein